MAEFNLRYIDGQAENIDCVEETCQDESTAIPTKKVRKRTRNESRGKPKKGLRKNVPSVDIAEIISNGCCKKVVFLPGHLMETRNLFNSLTYHQQNLYLTGLIIPKETKKSSGHRRKKNPIVNKNGKKVGRPKVREHILSFESRPSNYSRHKNDGRQYLSPELSIAKMHNMAHNPEYIQHLILSGSIRK